MLSHTFSKLSIAVLTVLSGFWMTATAKPGVDQYIANLEASNSSLLQYPTQFTQSIVPKQIHSHNDCKDQSLIFYPGTVGLTFCPFHRLERRPAVHRAELWRRERRGGCLVSLKLQMCIPPFK